MASIVCYKNGLKRIEFTLTPNGRPVVVRLGRINANAARTWRDKINAILADKAALRSHDPETAKWLGELEERMLGRLRAAGLAEGVGVAATTLGEFLERCEAAMPGKASTKTFYSHTRRNLREHFGAGKLLSEIRTEAADGWRAWLIANENLSPATVARRVIAARTMWRKAIRWKLTRENPFDGIKGGNQENDSRKHFVSREDIAQVSEQAPDAEWRLIIALARFGGLRCPSELFALKWGHIDWDGGRFIVHASKTEHHQGKGTRVVPIFAELLPLLREVYDQAEEGTLYVVHKHRLGSKNLRKQLERFIERAGMTPWPRLFQNLRASRETELMREYDLSTVCKWIGNSPAVAAKHYAMSVDLDGDFRRAAGLMEQPAAATEGDAEQGQEKGQGQGQDRAQMSGECSGRPETTGEPETMENASNSGDLDACGEVVTCGGEADGWAIQDSNL